MGDVVLIRSRRGWGKTGPQIRQPACFPPKLSAPPSVSPDVGAVRLTVEGEDHYVSAEDALLLASEIAHAAEVAFRLRREVGG